MATYNNDYLPQEDAMLWELHEIRRTLHAKFQQKSVEEINADARQKYRQWHQQYSQTNQQQDVVSV